MSAPVPDVRHGQHVRTKPVGVDQGSVFSPRDGRRLRGQQVMKRLFHRIMRLDSTGERPGEKHLARRRWHWRGPDAMGGAIAPPQFGDRHAVQRERAGLVGAQHGRRSKGLDGGCTPGEDASLRNPPGAHGEKDRQDHGELFGQHRHSHRNPGKKAIKPRAAEKSRQNEHEQCHRRPDRPEETHDAGELLLEARRLRRHIADGLTDAADLAARSGRGHLCERLPPHDQRSGENIRHIVPTRAHRGCRVRLYDLADRHRLSRQQRFIRQ